MANKVQFQTFRDGVCNFWVLDNERKPKLIMPGIRFADRIVGAKRNYLAQQAGITIKRMIRVPMWDPNPESIRAGMFVTIGDQQYKIEQAQKKPETIPLCMDITLENPEMFLDFNQEDGGTCGRV